MEAGVIDILITAKNEASAALSSVAEETQGLGSKVGGALGGITSKLGELGLASMGFDTVKEGVMSLIEPALQAQQTMAQTNTVLASTHDVSGMTSDSVEELATSLSKVTPFAKDVVQSSENMLLTFTNIGGSVMPQATESVLNMAQALGEDTKTASIQLGKALNDPIQGVTALQRVGVKLTDGQKEMVKQMVASGDVMGAQKLILGELDTEFGNSARAAGDTFAGKLTILHNQTELFKEQIGTKLIPVLTVLLGWFIQLSNWVGNHVTQAIGTLTTMLSGPFHAAWTLVRDAALTFIEAIQGNWTDSSKIEGIHRVVGNLGLALRSAWTEGEKLVGKVKDLWAAVSPLVPPLSTIYGYWRDISTIMSGPLASALIGAIKGFGADGLSGILPGAEQGLRDFLSAAEDLGGLTLDIGGKLLDALLNVNWSDLAGKIASGIGTAWGALTNAATYAYQWISGAFKSVNWSGLASSIATGIGTAWGALTTAGVWLYQWLSNGLKSVNWAGLGASISAGLSGALSSVKSAGGDSSALSGFFTSISKGFHDLMTAIQPFVTIWKGQLQAIFANLQTTLANIQPTLGPLVDAFKNLGTAIEPLGKILAGALLVYITAVLEEFVLLSQALSVVLPAAIQIATGVINALAAQITMIVSAIQDLVTIVVALFQGDWATAWQGAQQLVSDVITGMIGVVGSLAEGIFTAIDTATGGALSRFAQWVTDSVTSATSWVTGVVTAVAAFVVSGPQTITDAITGMVAAMVGAVQQFIDEGVAWIAGIISGIGQKVGELASKVGEIPGNILTAIGDVSQTLYDTGSAIIKGLISGIVDEVEGGLKDAVSGIAGKISSWKGPLDYDKTLLVPHGQAIIGGLIGGIQSQFGTLKDAAGAIGGILAAIDIPGWSPPHPAGFHMGQAFAHGWAAGIVDGTPDVTTAAAGIGHAAVNAGPLPGQGHGSPFMPPLPGQGHGSPFMPPSAAPGASSPPASTPPSGGDPTAGTPDDPMTPLITSGRPHNFQSVARQYTGHGGGSITNHITVIVDGKQVSTATQNRLLQSIPLPAIRAGA